ncbi:MAG: HAD hydrolase-like protein [Fibromonadaceae bacterium]|nr:HAD hydrolase-like protein [Fibromonadaceae bacterium]
MVLRLVLQCFLPDGLHTLRLIFAARKLYEQGLSDTERIAALAERFHISLEVVKSMIYMWMVEKPLPFIRLFRDRRLIADMEWARQCGIMLIVLSDYPTTEKLATIGFHPDAAYSAQELGCLKPCPDGLLRVLKDLELTPQDCLFIGDRMDKDGRLAEKIGMDYVMLPQYYCKRRLSYEMLGMRI